MLVGICWCKIAIPLNCISLKYLLGCSEEFTRMSLIWMVGGKWGKDLIRHHYSISMVASVSSRNWYSQCRTVLRHPGSHQSFREVILLSLCWAVAATVVHLWFIYYKWNRGRLRVWLIRLTWRGNQISGRHQKPILPSNKLPRHFTHSPILGGR